MKIKERKGQHRVKQLLGTIAMGIGLLYTIEGIASAIKQKKSRIANFVDIIYPAYVFLIMAYFLISNTIT